jgi:hypothetical protein
LSTTGLTARARLSSFDRLSSLRGSRGGAPHGRMVHHYPGVERNVCGRCLRRASRSLKEDHRQGLPVLRLAGGEAGETQEGQRSLQDSPVDPLFGDPQVKVAQQTGWPSFFRAFRMTTYANSTNNSSAYQAGDVVYVGGHSPSPSRSIGKACPGLTPLDGGGSGFSRDVLSQGIKSKERGFSCLR